MSGITLTKLHQERNFNGLKVGIVLSLFHEKICKNLLHGCLRALRDHGVLEKNIQVVEVPGSFEIPFVCRRLIDNGHFHVLITLGIVVKGETDHYEYVCKAVQEGLTKLNLAGQIPIIFEVLMAQTAKDAATRSSIVNMRKNKGYSAGLAAIQMATLIQEL